MFTFSELEQVLIFTNLHPRVAFDTIDHNILITRLSSWFGIQGSVLNWFESYLTSRSFRVKCDKDFSSEHISSCGVPKGSVLGPLSSCITTPLSTLISSLSLNHHLYADDTQLFSPSILVTLTQVSHLQTALQLISSWMSANLLTLNSSKTEFLIIGLKQQLSIIDNSSLNTTHSARNLGFIFDEHLTFSDQISSLSRSILSFRVHVKLSIVSYRILSHAILVSDNSAVSALTLMLKQPVPSLPLCPLKT